MKTKITISTDQETIEKAKIYAQKQKRSLSNLIENYLKFLAKDEIIEEKTQAPITKSLRRVFKVDDHFDYDFIDRHFLRRNYFLTSLNTLKHPPAPFKGGLALMVNPPLKGAGGCLRWVK
jgi:Family of unknown function (DUF6364)